MNEKKWTYTLVEGGENQVYRFRMSEECARFFEWLQSHDFIYDGNGSVTLSKDEIDEIIEFE